MEKAFVESREEMEQILDSDDLGFLGVSRDGDTYVVPLNYAYVDGRILFHCALTGKKLDYIQANPRVCFTVGKQTGQVRDHGPSDACHPDYESVICYGTARIVSDLDERARVLNEFNRYYEPDAEDLARDRVETCGAVEIVVDEMTGRRERNKKTTFWRYTFEGRDTPAEE